MRGTADERAWRRSLACWLYLLLCAHQASSLDLQQAAAPSSGKLSDQLLQTYLSNEQLAAWMDEFVHKCGHIARKLSIGKSANGQQLWVLEVSDRPGQEEPEPNFKYIGNMHGDEPSGRMLLPQLAEWLCANYGKEARASRIVAGMHLFLMPSLNPDGFATRRRANAQLIDLNRNFPDANEVASLQQLAAPLPDAAPETRALMAWSLSKHFSAAANLHEGAVLANIPFDGYPDHSMTLTRVRAPSPDDATFSHLARLYAAKHAFMASSPEFPQGVTNGAAWYPVYGGMQDWDYLAAGCMDITLELSERKWRPPGDLAALWEENRDALLALPMAALLGGVSGLVLSAADGAPLAGAVVAVDGIRWNTSAQQPFGFFQRPLAPGSYTLVASADGYATSRVNVTVPADGSGARHNFTLAPAASSPAAAADAAAVPAAAAAAAVPAAVQAAAVPAAVQAAAPASTSSSSSQQAPAPALVSALFTGGSAAALRARELTARLHRNGANMALLGGLLCVLGAWAALYVCQGIFRQQPRGVRSSKV